MELNLGIADLAAKFYVRQTREASERSSVASIVGVYTATQSVRLVYTPEPSDYYKCVTPGFGKLYDAVIASAGRAAASRTDADFSALLDALAAFYATYGTGFVSELGLVAYGVVEGVFTRRDGSLVEVLTTGGGVAASLPFVGAEAAGQYVQTHTDENMHATFRARAFGRPSKSEQAKWAVDTAKNLDGKSLSELTSGQAWSHHAPPAEVAAPKDPELHYQAIDLTQTPIPVIPGIGEILGMALKALQFINIRLPLGGVQPGRLADAAKVGKAVTDKVGELKETARKTEAEINDAAFGGPRVNPAAGEPGAESAALPRRAAGVDASAARPSRAPGNAGGGFGDTALDLGGYTQSAYKYWPWGKVFPALKLALECTPAQVVLGQSLAWFSMRDTFAQYLEFCANFPGVTLNKRGTPVDIRNRAGIFRAALDEVGDFLTEELKSKPGLDFLRELEEQLANRLKRRRFDMSEHYRFWIDNYHWLKEAPFGVVAVVERNGEYHYQADPYPGNPMRDSDQPRGCDIAPSLLPTDLLTANAYRLYPIISTTVRGEPHFAWVGAPSPLRGDREDNVLRYSGLMSFYPDPRLHPSFRPAFGDWAPAGVHHVAIPPDDVFEETALPMLIHQSEKGAEEIAWAEGEFTWPVDGGNPRSGQDVLAERWANRKRVFGMHLYPGVGDQDCFGHEYRVEDVPGPFPFPGRREIRDVSEGSTARLLRKAGELAHEATKHATVLPDPKRDGEDGYEIPWGLKAPAGVLGAYFDRHDATFFWGPKGGSGWGANLFEECPVRFVPIGHLDVHDALLGSDGDPAHFNHAHAPAWARAGGGAMWREPRIDLMGLLNRLGSETESDGSA